MKLDLKVVPGSSRDTVAGWLGDALKIKVKAPPQQGEANRAVISLLASALGIDESDITLRRGHGSARKTVEIAGMDDAELRRRLQAN